MKTFMKSFLLLASLWLFTHIAFAQQAKPQVYQELQPKPFAQTLSRTKGIILDVRTPEEYAEGHLSQARNIDYKNDNFRQVVNKLDKTRPYFVYCKAGVRSARAADIMKELGFKQVYTLEGGMDAWEDERMKTVK